MIININRKIARYLFIFLAFILFVLLSPTGVNAQTPIIEGSGAEFPNTMKKIQDSGCNTAAWCAQVARDYLNTQFPGTTMDCSGSPDSSICVVSCANGIDLVIKNPAPAPPPSTDANCPAPSNQAALSWGKSTLASRYEVRIDDQSIPYGGATDPSCNPSFCHSVSDTSFSFTGKPGVSYRWWVRACNVSGGCNPQDTAGPSFTCPAPTPTPTATPTPTPPAPKSAPCPIPAGLPGEGNPYGDLDGDNKVSMNDRLMILRIVSGMESFLDTAIEAADIDGAPGVVSKSSDVTATDALMIENYLKGSVSTFPVCSALPTATPAPTSPPGATNTPIPTATPAPTSPPGATNTPIPTATPAPTSPPGATNTPIPTATPAPTSPPGATNTPIPTAIPTQAPSPTPAFNPAACKCDGIEPTEIFSGQALSVTSFAKVEGADVTRARVVDQKFFLAEGAETMAKIISRSNPIPASIVSSSPTLVRYASKWDLTLPQLKSGATYRIWSQINCQPKTTVYTGSRGVLAEQTENLSFLQKILRFFGSLFGGGSKTQVIESQPTVTPALQGTTPPESGIQQFYDPTPAKRDNLQLDTFYPGEIYQKTCSFIKFRFDGPVQ